MASGLKSLIKNVPDNDKILLKHLSGGDTKKFESIKKERVFFLCLFDCPIRLYLPIEEQKEKTLVIN